MSRIGWGTGLILGMLAMAMPQIADAEEDDEIGTGQLLVLTKDQKKVEIPLAHTSVEAFVGGFVARVNVTQTFVNKSKEPIEAVYVFPLPHEAAVDDMTMTIGKRVVKGVIKKREEARQIYEAAKAAGKTASLLDQERPNIFTQSVANIMPGDDIKIEISYVESLKYEEGEYEFVFPMVVGPRYIPGEFVLGKKGGGWAPDTNRVPDASRITPPVLKPGERSGHDIDVTVHLNAGVPFHELRSTSHMITVDKKGDAAAEVRLDERDTIPNKDLIVRYKVLGDAPQSGVLTWTKDGEGHFLLVLAPKANYEDKEIRSREILFVVDSSGSQQGDPLVKSKEAVKRALRGLRADDTFQVFNFNDIVTSMAPGPVPATAENVRDAAKFIDQIQATGGTRMLPVIQTALNWPADPKRLRIVFMTTDGYIGNETEIIGEIHRNLGDARLFTLGCGSSLNRYLIDRMSEEGKGFAQFVRQDEPTNEVVEKFHKRIDAPVLTDIQIDWGGLQVAGQIPAKVPDLFAGQPLVVHGKFTKPGEATVRLAGKTGKGPTEIAVPVKFPAENGGYSALGTMWARAKIGELSAEMTNKGHTNQLVEEITKLGLDYRLVTEYTSFVAVEEKVRNEGGKQVTVQVPVEMPEGVSYEGVFGKDREEVDQAVMTGSGYGMGSGGMVGGAVAAPPAMKSVAPAKPMVSTQGKAMSRSSANMVAADEAEGSESGGPFVDPVAFLGIASEGPYRDALTKGFTHEVAKKLSDFQKTHGGKSAMVKITIDAQGKVTKVEVMKNETGESDVVDILQKGLAKIAFPAPGNEASIVFFVRF